MTNFQFQDIDLVDVQASQTVHSKLARMGSAREKADRGNHHQMIETKFKRHTFEYFETVQNG